MIRFIFILLFVCSSISALLAQSGEAQAVVTPCQIKEFVNRSGWNIPGLSKAVVKASRARCGMYAWIPPM